MEYIILHASLNKEHVCQRQEKNVVMQEQQH